MCSSNHILDASVHLLIKYSKDKNASHRMKNHSIFLNCTLARNYKKKYILKKILISGDKYPETEKRIKIVDIVLLD